MVWWQVRPFARAGAGAPVAGCKLPFSTSFVSLSILHPDDHCHRVVRSGKGHRLSEGQDAPAKSGQKGREMEVWESIVGRGHPAGIGAPPEGVEQTESDTV